MIRSKFGVFIPPWGKPDQGETITLEFVLTGKIPAKKNRQRASFNYSWALSQVRTFFKIRNEVTAKECLKFVIHLIKNIHPYIYKPQWIVDWEEENIKRIIEQAAWYATQSAYKDKGLRYPITKCSISIRFYWADEHTRDNDNRQQTIHDILQKAGIISTDSYKCLFKDTAEAKHFPGQITDHIASIFVTAYKW